MSSNEEIVGDGRWLKQTKESREIVHKILEFGVTQYQMLKIIEILSLELEDKNTIVSIRDSIKVEIEKQEQKIKNRKEIIL